jgi:hypothetical protein
VIDSTTIRLPRGALIVPPSDAESMLTILVLAAVPPINASPGAPRAQRPARLATALELRSAFINQPVEVAALRQQFATYQAMGDRRPDLVVRIGRGPEMPRSLRRPVEQVLV